MPLTFDTTGIKNYEEVCYDDTDSLRPITNALIHASMMTGMYEITEENAAGFWARLHLYEKASGPYLISSDPGPHYIQPQAVINHIGLRTNASSDANDAEWATRIIPQVLTDLRRYFKVETKETPQQRLEYLRGELQAERISQGELAELQDLVEHIEPGDVELLEPAGVPEELAYLPKDERATALAERNDV